MGQNSDTLLLMKQRSLPKMLLLFFVTLGIYRLYWLAKTRGELIRKTKVKIPPIWLYVLPLIITLVAVAGYVATSIGREVRLQDNVDLCIRNNSTEVADVNRYCESTEYNNIDITGVEVVFLVAFYVSVIIIWPLIGWWYWKYAQGVEKITKEKMSFPIAMLVVLTVPDGFDMLVMQDSFNKVKKGS